MRARFLCEALHYWYGAYDCVHLPASCPICGRPPRWGVSEAVCGTLDFMPWRFPRNVLRVAVEALRPPGAPGTA